MRADLHVHSTASDGTLTPSSVVELAAQQRVDVLALADHDSVAGVAPAMQAADEVGITLVPAVELSSAIDDYDVHVLAYFVDHRDRHLLEMLDTLKAARMRRAESMVQDLREAGFNVSIDEVLAISDGGAVGRSHIARALVAAGHAESVAEAFQRFIGRNRPFYRPKDARTPAQVVEAVRELGAVPVLAHPGITGADHLVRELVDAGLLGIEAYHADHTAEQRAHYAAIARSFGLVCTGGTDYHGPHAPNPQLGSTDVPDECIEAFLALGKAE